MLEKKKGYLSQTAGGEWILSEDPHLKSCCAGKHPQHIFLEGDFPSAPQGQLLTFRGEFVVQGERQLLKNAELAQEMHTPYYTLSILALAGGFWLFRKLNTNSKK